MPTLFFEIAINLNNLGALKHAQRKLDEAEPLYWRALAIKEKLLGDEHPDVAITLNNLAVLLRLRGKPGEATELFRRALAIYETTLDPNHPKLLACRSNYERCRTS